MIRLSCFLLSILLIVLLLEIPILNSSFEEYDNKGILTSTNLTQTILITLLGFIITFIFFSKSTLKKLNTKIDESRAPFFSFIIALLGTFIYTNSFHVFILLLKLGIFKNTSIFISLLIISELLRSSLDTPTRLNTFKSKILLMVFFFICIVSTGSTITLFVFRKEESVSKFKPVVYDFFAPFLANIVVYLHKYITSKWKSMHRNQHRFSTFILVDLLITEAMYIANYYVIYKITHFALISFISAILGSLFAQISDKIILMHGEAAVNVEKWFITCILPLLYFIVTVFFFYEYYSTLWPKIAEKNLTHFVLHGIKALAISVTLRNRTNLERINMKIFQHDKEIIKWMTERTIYVFFEILSIYLIFLLIRGHGTYFLLRIAGSLIGITVSNIFNTLQEKNSTTKYTFLKNNLTNNTQHQLNSEEEEGEEEGEKEEEQSDNN